MSGCPGGQEINVNFLDLRPAIARRHNVANFVLLNAMVLASVLLSFAALRLWSAYKTVAAESAVYSRPLTIIEFLLQNPGHLLSQARKVYKEREKELQESQERSKSQSKTQAIFKQWQEEIRAKLEAALALPLPEAEKQKIQSCLARGDLEEMKALADRLEKFHPQKSAEDRLNSLLETLKEYCEPSDFAHYQQEAFAALHEKGFREAREFVVRAHAELRFRAKKSSV